MTDLQFLAWLKDPLAIPCVLVEVVARIGSTETTLYLSNRGYVTAGGDTPAHTAYQAVVVGGVEMSESLSLDGSASVSFGDIELLNADGRLDGWLDYVWANRTIQVYMGDAMWPRADFKKVFDGVVGDITSRASDVLNISLLSKLERLNNPITDTTLGGTTANKDRLLPLVFGECSNVEPLLTNPATLEFQVHNGPIEGVIEVRDNGAPRSVSVNATTGKFTLPSAVVGQITCDVQGYKPATYSNTISALVQALATGFGPAATRFSGADLDATQLASFAAAHTQPVGYYAKDRANVLQACQELAASVGAQVVCSTTGLLRLVKLAVPGVTPSITGSPWSITASDIDALSLSVQERPPVRSTIKLGYCRNWTVQTSGLASGLVASSAASFGVEYLTTTASNSTVASVYKLDAQPVQENTLLLGEADASAEASRRLALWSVQRAVYSVQAQAHLLLAELGDAATITHQRFGLSAGKTGVVVSIQRNWLARSCSLGVLV